MTTSPRMRHDRPKVGLRRRTDRAGSARTVTWAVMPADSIGVPPPVLDVGRSTLPDFRVPRPLYNRRHWRHRPALPATAIVAIRALGIDYGGCVTTPAG